MTGDDTASGPPVREAATIAFIDLAGFSSITNVYGDDSAIAMLEIFEEMVRNAVEGHAPPIKWIGDEVMLFFPEPKLAIGALGRLLTSCRQDERLPLTRTAVHHGPVVRRAGDLFGSTVNIAARIAALAGPGQLLATQLVAEVATEEGIAVKDLGRVAIRSLPDELPLYEIHVAPTPDPAWIDPVCKMHAPFETYRRMAPGRPWFCSPRCAEAYARSPRTYPLVQPTQSGAGNDSVASS
jgi:adenylate cyclase